jgi:hypothetical protein
MSSRVAIVVKTYCFGAQTWSIYLRNGIWYYTNAKNEEVQYGDISTFRWYMCGDRVWQSLEATCDVDLLDDFETMAFEIMPYWAAKVSEQYTTQQIKMWSHIGVTKTFGDIGNRAMGLLVTLLLKFREARGCDDNWNTNIHYYWTRRNAEGRGDQLEAIMGLREAYPDHYDHVCNGNVVDRLCSKVFCAWKLEPEIVNEWNEAIVVQFMFCRFGLNLQLEHAYQATRRNRLGDYSVVFGTLNAWRLPHGVILIITSMVVGPSVQERLQCSPSVETQVPPCMW